MDISIIRENEGIPTAENIYQYGKILDENNLNYYKLKIEKLSDYMCIQFSTNSREIDFSINEKFNETKNSSFKFESDVKEGKVFIKLITPKYIDYIYLNVFLKKKNKIDNNYVFKYINGDELKDYPILKNDSIIYKIREKNKKTKNITIMFNRIESKVKKIIYSVKLIRLNISLNNEIDKTIALTQNSYILHKIENIDNNSIISLNIDNFDDTKLKCIEVIAHIIDGEINEYIAYEPYFIKKII